MSAIPEQTTLKIMVTQPAVAEFKAIPAHIRAHLIDVIKAKAVDAGNAPIVIGWTMDGNRPHIFRVFKDYVYPPGWRVIFHRTLDGISIDRVARRDCDPYLDGK